MCYENDLRHIWIVIASTVLVDIGLEGTLWESHGHQIQSAYARKWAIIYLILI